MAKRTHSTIDKLPAAIRQTITRMVVDGFWPDGFDAVEDRHGKPTYGDIVIFCDRKGFEVSHSAIGRWGKNLVAMELMRSKAQMVRTVMSDITAEKVSETQKAVTEVITAQALDLALTGDLSAKQIRELSTAIAALAKTAITADQYIRSQIEAKAKAADKKITALVKKKQIDPETLKMIREQIYGIID